MKFTYDPSGDVGILALNGKLTVDRAAELKKFLMKSMENANHVIIQIEKVTEVDISCLQLLCSAHRTFLNLNKNLVLNRPGNGIFTDTVKAAGYSRLKACNLSPDKSCFWTGF